MPEQTPIAAVAAGRPAAHGLPPGERAKMAVDTLSGKASVAATAKRLGVSRKFVAAQAQLADDALRKAFEPPEPDKEVLFYLPVTRHWLRQFVLVLLLVCRSSFRGAAEAMECLLDHRQMSVGQVHAIAAEAMGRASEANAQERLSGVRATAQDEIFQSGKPVLAGLDQRSTYCFLLSEEKSRDADTWALRLLECQDRGLNPDYAVADGGQGQRAGMRMVWPGTPCFSDSFHALYELGKVKTFLEHKAYSAIAALDDVVRRQAKARRKGKARSFSSSLGLRRAEAASRIALFDDVCSLLGWLRDDILAFNGLSPAQRGELLDWVVMEIQSREELCPARLPRVRKYLQNQRDDLLGPFAHLDKELAGLAATSGAPMEALRQFVGLEAKAGDDELYWRRRAELGRMYGWQLDPLLAEVRELMDNTHKTSSVVENLNSRLRCYFFLRRQIGKGYLDLLRFFLNHRRFPRSAEPGRVGKSPAELLSGEPHPHWLEMLGYQRFARA